VDGTPGQDTRSLGLSTTTLLGVDRAFAVDGLTKGVNDTTEKLHTDGNVDNGLGPLDRVTLLNQSVVTEDGNTDVVGLQVQGHSTDTRGELNHFLGLNVLKTVDTGDTVSNGQDATGLLKVATCGSTGDAALEDGGNLGSSWLSSSIASGSGESALFTAKKIPTRSKWFDGPGDKRVQKGVLVKANDGVAIGTMMFSRDEGR